MSNYKRKRPSQWRDKDKRMAAAVRMRGEGLSLRQIAKELAVSYQTVLRDLQRWARERPNVVLLSQTTVTSHPAWGQLVTAECDNDPAVIELRRHA